MAKNYSSCLLNRRYRKDCQKSVGASQTSCSKDRIQSPIFRISPTLWETKQGHLEPASIAGFGSAIPGPSHTRRLAAYSAPHVPIGRPDTPSDTRRCLSYLSTRTPRTAPKRTLSADRSSPEFFIRNLLNTMPKLLYASTRRRLVRHEGEIRTHVRANGCGAVTPHPHREIPRLEART
jgi:hypothetical protein